MPTLATLGTNFRIDNSAPIVIQALQRTARNTEIRFLKASEKPFDAWQRRGMGHDATMWFNGPEWIYRLAILLKQNLREQNSAPRPWRKESLSARNSRRRTGFCPISWAKSFGERQARSWLR